MKKIIAIILILALVLSLSACSQSAAPEYTAVWGKSSALETSTYKITVEQSEDEFFAGAPTVGGEGTYVSSISGSDDGYTLETTLDFAGTIAIDGKTENFTQKITSVVKFGGVVSKFAPTYSEKNYEGTTISYDSESDAFSTAPLAYTSKVTYEYGKANVSIAKADGTAVADGIATSSEIDLNKIAYYDNEQLYMIIRALDKAKATQLSYSVVNPITGLTPIAVQVSQDQEEEQAKTVTMQINGKSETFEVQTVSAQINSSFESGSPTYLMYAKGDMGNASTSAGNVISVDRSRLIQIMQQVPYSASAFLFELEEFTTNAD